MEVTNGRQVLQVILMVTHITQLLPNQQQQVTFGTIPQHLVGGTQHL